MSMLQWTLLIVLAAAVVGLYLGSRGSNRGAKRAPKTPSRQTNLGANQANASLPAAEQAELFTRGQFDEYGVGKPRKRTAPQMSGASSAPQQTLFEPPPPPAPQPKSAPKTATRTAPVMGVAAAPAIREAAPGAQGAPEKIFALLIAEHEGTAVMGPKLHAALQQQGLQFGARQIYHRMLGEQMVFSVASLLKPGALDPADAQAFSTPGLSVFMVLPGPVQPAAAYADMAATARALAASLNAAVFDAQRQPFTAERERAQKAEVEAWARTNRL